MRQPFTADRIAECWPLEQSEEARSELARAQEFAKRASGPDPLALQGQGRVFWQDGAIARVLLKEAEHTDN